MAQKQNKSGLTRAQADALRRRKTSFGVVFVRSRPIRKVKDRDGKLVLARNSGEVVVPSQRLFATDKEASHHGKRFVRLEGHRSFFVTFVRKSPNAWVNFKSGKTNPLIGRKRTNRR